jgi:predicted GNAT family acetyltransferase
MSENAPRFQEHERYRTGVQQAIFELGVPNAYLKVELYANGLNDYDPHSVQVKDIRIPEQERGKGLGQILQKALLDECRKKGITKIYGSTQNPYVLLSWLKIDEVRGKLFLRITDSLTEIDYLNDEDLETWLREAIERKNITNTDAQPQGSHFYDYVIHV